MKSGNKPFIVERTMTSETEDFGIDPSVIPALFDNIYKNKVRTLTQEYMSNARDANREVNASRPIEVTLPSPFVATLIIRDFGPGIDPDRMSKVFIQIGRSTKTQTNTQTGGFGVGCKSYFAYGETFHINTYIQGTKRSYTCWKDGDKQLHIDFHRQLECPTDEPNGTEITLPVLVKDIEEFNRAVFRSTYFWKESERAIVRGLNSSHPYHEKNHQISVIEFCSGDVKFPTFISNRIGKPDTFCLIDGIPYPLNEGIREKVPEIKELEQLCAPNTCLIIHLNNGTVRVAISREDIDNSSQTINALREILSLAIPKVKADIESKLKFTSLENFIDVVKNIRKLYKVDNQIFESFAYQGSSILCPDFKKIIITKKNKKTSRSGSNERILTALPDEEFFQNSFYYEDNVESKNKTNKKIAQFLESREAIFIFDPLPILEKTEVGVIPGSNSVIEESSTEVLNRLISLLQIKPISDLTYKKPVSSNILGLHSGPRPTKEEISYSLIKKGQRQSIKESIETLSLSSNTKKMIYINPTDYGAKKPSIMDLKYYLDSIQCLGINFITLSKKELKKVEHLPNFISFEMYKEQYAPMENEVISFMYKSRLNNKPIKGLTSLKIKNKEMLELIALYKDNFSSYVEPRYSYRDCVQPDFIEQKLLFNEKVQSFLEKDKGFTKLIEKKYSLLQLIEFAYMSENQKKDLENYIDSQKENE